MAENVTFKPINNAMWSLTQAPDGSPGTTGLARFGGGSANGPSRGDRGESNLAGPRTFAPTGPVSTLNGADRSNLGFGNPQRKRPGVGTLGFNPPPTQPQFSPGGASSLSSFLQNSRVR